MGLRSNRNNIFSSGSKRKSPRGIGASKGRSSGQFGCPSRGGLSLGNRGEARRQSQGTVRNVSGYAAGPGGGRSRGGHQPVGGFSGSRGSCQNRSFPGGSGSGSRGSYNHVPVNRGGSRGSSRDYGTQRTYASNRQRTDGTRSVRLGDIPPTCKSAGIAIPSGLIKKAIAVVAVIAVLAAIYGGLYFSGLFKVEQVKVAGAEHLTEQAIIDLADVPSNANMLTVDTNVIRSNILSNGWVADVSVNKMLPSTLQLNVTERTIQAVVEVTSKDAETTEKWGVSTDGYWLMKIPEKDSEEAAGISEKVFEDAESVLHVVDVPYGVVPEAGAQCNDDNINNALAIIGGMTTELRDQVKVVSADGAETTTLTLDNGVEIAFGSDEDIRDKERVCLELLKEHEGSIAYINVRLVNRPTWRALG